MATGRIPTTANSPLTVKGDLFGYSTTQARVPVGNDGETLVADSSTSTGLNYKPLDAAGKNAVINGGFDIWQRGTSFTADGSYTADRWRLEESGATATVTQQSFTVGQTDVPNNPKYFLRLAVTTGDNACRIVNVIEDVTTFSGQTITISFWAKGTNPAGGSLEVFFRQSFGSGGSTEVATLAGSITLTSSWQRFTKTLAVPSVSGKTVGAGNSWQIDVRQPIADTGAAAWTLDLSNVQAELGSTATAFQTATGTIQGELAACQRYYEKSFNVATAPTTAAQQGYFTGKVSSNTVANEERYGFVSFKVSKRGTPTITIRPYTTTTNTARVSNPSGTDLGANSGVAISAEENGFGAYNNSGGTLTTVNQGVIFHWEASSEL